jgi:hypothetical protein
MDIGWKLIYTGIVFVVLGALTGVVCMDDDRVTKPAMITVASGVAIVVVGILLKIWMS